MSNTCWGCPWHGLVESGSLQTPNGPLAIGHTSHSDTHLIDFGMPAVDTPAEHQAKGMSWLNKAIISGGRLHGTELPEGSWIWRDDNDENWLVEVEDTYFGKADGQPIEVVLNRFGVIGATVRETYTYSVNMPSAGADYAAHYGGSARAMALKMRDVSPRGNAAVFGVRLPAQGWFASWAELTLSGTGAACAPSLGIVRSASVTAGSRTDADLAPIGIGYAAYTHTSKTSTGSIPEVPHCTGQLVETWSGKPVHYAAGEPEPPAGSHIYSVNVWSLDAEKSLKNVIVGMTYSATGDLVELSADLVVSVVGGSPIPAEQWQDTVRTTTGHGMSGSACLPDVSTSYGWVSVSLNAQATLKAKVSLRVGGQLAHEVTQVVTLSRTAAVEHTRGGPYGIQTATDIETTWSSDGRSKTSRLSIEPGNSITYISMSSSSFGTIIFPENAVAEPSISFIVPTDTDDFAVMRMLVVRYSNNVIGIHKELTGNQSSPSGPPGSVPLEYDTGNAVATPLGQRTVAEEKGAGSSPDLHASFNPITGQAARSSNRVNWI